MKNIFGGLYAMDIKKTNAGNIVISEEVIEKIAMTAALDVVGVVGCVERTLNIESMLKTKKVTKACVAIVKDDQYVIDIYLKVAEGVQLSELAKNVQKNIKEAVQNMTENVVTKINVHICEVDLKK